MELKTYRRLNVGINGKEVLEGREKRHAIYDVKCESRNTISEEGIIREY